MTDKSKAKFCLRGLLEIDFFEEDKEFTIGENCFRCPLKIYCFQEIKKSLRIDE